ncbi:acyl-CoA dehydrogenase family protein [Allobranchiibius huperziae]|uniref:Putative acyl-CoA dehydrogenase n=1 Tax=Allobranchiibius huperziae TaxID=1874116 RepID=A0A853D9K9_9MICO|nr:acyl-CoA dehydrogenase family protein [Allobranchiibius huperziae]NYJ74166.1 putative acyl-CoA dehydrogenase [Allobranchiibius huperziae]
MSHADPFERSPDNQPPPLEGYDAIASDAALLDAIRAQAPEGGGAEILASLRELGTAAGSAEAREHGRLANAHPPVLRTADRFGLRIDEVEFHPSWHWMLRTGVGLGLAGAAWTSDEPDAHLRRAAGFVAWTGIEPGHACPMTMTYAAVPALAADPAQAARWTALLASATYDPGLREPTGKAGLLAGMGMTEKQGGSDVRTNSTVATARSSGDYTLRGHKWFTSAPMNDLFFVLAQAPGGLSCFVVPRVRPDGSRNAVRIVRLKDKLGNRSNASAELEFEDAHAVRLGEEGRGVRTIIEMVAATRLDCVLGSAALMRRAVAEASWHAAHRSAFGSVLIEKPAMSGVIADLALESEGATMLALRLAHSVDRRTDPHEIALRRIALPLAKFWVCKRTPPVCVEAMECLGGNGYVEESGMPLLVRESPLNSIWEGSGNVNALDVLRAATRSPDAVQAWRDEVALAGAAALDAAAESVVDELRAAAADPVTGEGRARRIAARMAVVLQGSLLARHSPSYVADAFLASRVEGGDRGVFGALPPSVGPTDTAAIVRRALPHP